MKEIEADFRECERYNTTLVTKSRCIIEYRGLRESHTGRAASADVSKFNYDKFARLCLEDEWTVAELEYAVGQWDRKDTAFPPTYGQLLAMRHRGRQDIRGPGNVRVIYYKQRIDEVKRKLAERKGPKS